jgi:3',5'-cyclic AMP phosphodiesterase CpdA
VFVLAHLSDPHLGPLAKPHPLDLAGKRILGYLHWHHSRKHIHLPATLAAIVADLKSQSPDHIANTGDLVNIALPAEFAPARAFLETLGPPSDVTLVPGNHDAYVQAGIAHADHHWGDYMRGDLNANAPGFPFLRRRGPVALIGLSTAVPSRPFMATGTLGLAQLHQLGDLLDAIGEDAFRIVLLHHPPVATPGRHRERLLDARAFRDTLKKHGADLVLHGHDHVHSLAWLDGKSHRIPAVGVPSASGAAANRHNPAGYNLYRIEGRKGAWRCEMISRGLRRDGDSVVELNRIALSEAAAD